MTFQVLAPETQPCVWMAAGQISYKLCDRGFDCENCPLDAALRGQIRSSSPVPASLDQRTGEALFPEDRLYSPGHLWVQALAHDDQRLWRVGLDAFAAALIGCTTAVRWELARETVHRGDRVCDLDLGMGTIPIAAPISGRVVEGNRTLLEHPRSLVTDPYGEGWLLEVEGLDPGAILGLRAAGRHLEQTRLDLRRFRRTLALQLLIASGADPVLGGSDDALRDLRQVLCGPRYLEILGQFVH